MKTDKIYNEAQNRLKTLAKNLLMDIISRRIAQGIMVEDEKGCYQIDCETKNPLHIKVWVNDTYTDGDYQEDMRVEGFGLDEFPYVILANGTDEVITGLSIEDMVRVCNALEKINENESNQ